MTMHLMTSAPPATSARTRSRTSLGISDDPEPEADREVHRRRLAGDLAAAARAGDVRTGALHPRARRPAGVDGVAERHVDERPERPEVADAREPGLQRVARIADPAHRLLRRRAVDGRDAGVLEVADLVAVPVDEPGDDPVTLDGDRLGVRRSGVAGAEYRFDPVAGEQQPPVIEPQAGGDVEQVGRRGSGGASREGSSAATMRAMTTTDRLPFTGDEEADRSSPASRWRC